MNKKSLLGFIGYLFHQAGQKIKKIFCSKDDWKEVGVIAIVLTIFGSLCWVVGKALLLFNIHMGIHPGNEHYNFAFSVGLIAVMEIFITLLISAAACLFFSSSWKKYQRT